MYTKNSAARIQKLSVDETANILQGLSRSGYMLKNSWKQSTFSILYIQCISLSIQPVASTDAEKNRIKIHSKYVYFTVW